MATDPRPSAARADDSPVGPYGITAVETASRPIAGGRGTMHGDGGRGQPSRRIAVERLCSLEPERFPRAGSAIEVDGKQVQSSIDYDDRFDVMGYQRLWDTGCSPPSAATERSS